MHVVNSRVWQLAPNAGPAGPVFKSGGKETYTRQLPTSESSPREWEIIKAGFKQ